MKSNKYFGRLIKIISRHANSKDHLLKMLSFASKHPANKGLGNFVNDNFNVIFYGAN